MAKNHRYSFIIGNTKIPLFYMPTRNPNTVTFKYKKEFQRTQAVGGNVFEHWGKQPTEMRVEMLVMKTGYIGGFVGAEGPGVVSEVSGRQGGMYQDPLINSELTVLKKLFELDRRRINPVVSPKNADAKSQTDTVAYTAADAAWNSGNIDENIVAVSQGFISPSSNLDLYNYSSLTDAPPLPTFNLTAESYGNNTSLLTPPKTVTDNTQKVNDVASGKTSTLSSAIGGLQKAGSAVIGGVQSGLDMVLGNTGIESWLNQFSDTIIYYKDNIYSGFFTDIEIPEVGAEPWYNKVTFNFIITNTLSDSINESLATGGVGRTVSGALGAVTSTHTVYNFIKEITENVGDLIGNNLSELSGDIKQMF